MVAYVADADLARWEIEGRHDIMSRVRGEDIIWSGDRIVSSSGKKLKNCIYLGRVSGAFFCEIYETRPLVCRSFSPGSSELCPLFSNKK